MPHRRTYEELSTEEVLAAVERLGQPTTAEVCRELKCRGRAARLHLETLHDAGQVSRQARGLVRQWSVADTDK